MWIALRAIQNLRGRAYRPGEVIEEGISAATLRRLEDHRIVKLVRKTTQQPRADLTAEAIAEVLPKESPQGLIDSPESQALPGDLSPDVADVAALFDEPSPEVTVGVPAELPAPVAKIKPKKKKIWGKRED